MTSRSHPAGHRTGHASRMQNIDCTESLLEPVPGKPRRLRNAFLIVLFWMVSIAFVVGARGSVRLLGGGWEWLDVADVLAVFAAGAFLGRTHPGVRDIEDAVGIGAVWLTLSIVAEVLGTTLMGGDVWISLLEDGIHGGIGWSIALMAAWLLAPVIAMRRRG